MTPFIEKATIWRAGALDAFGRPGWSAPDVVDCRWEDVERLFSAEGGEQRTSKSVVYISTPAKIGDFIFRGVSSAAAPITGSHSIRSYRNVRNVLGDKQEHRVIL